MAGEVPLPVYAGIRKPLPHGSWGSGGTHDALAAGFGGHTRSLHERRPSETTPAATLERPTHVSSVKTRSHIPRHAHGAGGHGVCLIKTIDGGDPAQLGIVSFCGRGICRNGLGISNLCGRGHLVGRRSIRCGIRAILGGLGVGICGFGRTRIFSRYRLGGLVLTAK